MHLSDAELDTCVQRGDTALESPVRRHLAGCDRCTTRVTALRAEAARTEELLALLDHELPAVDPESLIRRARRTEKRQALAVAAGVAGLLVAGAAVAIPGSPVRGWIADVLGEGERGAATSAPPSAGAPLGPGVRFLPSGPVEIEFEASQESGHVLVIRSTEAVVSVRAVQGTASFSVGRDRVRVENRGSAATYEVGVPSNLRTLRVTIAGTTALELVAGRLTLPPGVDASRLQEGVRLPFPDAEGSR